MVVSHTLAAPWHQQHDYTNHHLPAVRQETTTHYCPEEDIPAVFVPSPPKIQYFPLPSLPNLPVQKYESPIPLPVAPIHHNHIPPTQFLPEYTPPAPPRQENIQPIVPAAPHDTYGLPGLHHTNGLPNFHHESTTLPPPPPRQEYIEIAAPHDTHGHPDFHHESTTLPPPPPPHQEYIEPAAPHQEYIEPAAPHQEYIEPAAPHDTHGHPDFHHESTTLPPPPLRQEYIEPIVPAVPYDTYGLPGFHHESTTLPPPPPRQENIEPIVPVPHNTYGVPEESSTLPPFTEPPTTTHKSKLDKLLEFKQHLKSKFKVPEINLVFNKRIEFPFLKNWLNEQH
ncbi:uncharacterized protein [Chironomus tepperi]|uniref:uncharacterized protein n=1 Tax=Chironomus tepperi TaxID=113505 RepID=UPI00391EF1D3